jgi:hypothetical protein
MLEHNLDPGFIQGLPDAWSLTPRSTARWRQVSSTAGAATMVQLHAPQLLGPRRD